MELRCWFLNESNYLFEDYIINWFGAKLNVHTVELLQLFDSINAERTNLIIRCNCVFCVFIHVSIRELPSVYVFVFVLSSSYPDTKDRATLNRFV